MRYRINVAKIYAEFVQNLESIKVCDKCSIDLIAISICGTILEMRAKILLLLLLQRSIGWDGGFVVFM